MQEKDQVLEDALSVLRENRQTELHLEGMDGSIFQINLPGKHLGDDRIVPIAKALKENTILESLDLVGCVHLLKILTA